MSGKWPLRERGRETSRLVLGCMGLGGGWNRDPIEPGHVKHAHEAVEAALESGITMFDHADIYTMGKAEAVFGQVLKEKPGLRERMVIQSKCGIRFQDGPRSPGRYDFSKEHILGSVDGILTRLGIDSLDILLLHRPDPLMDPEEVGEALASLKQSGKVSYFGVSNMSAAQIRFLQAHCPEPLIANQLEMSLARHDWLDSGVLINRSEGASTVFPEGTLEYCRMEGIQIQAWGPLAQGRYTGRQAEATAQEPESTIQTRKLVLELAEEKNVSAEAIVLGWLMRHPAGIQPVIGTANPERIRACAQASGVQLTREEWYSLYVSARGKSMP